jgi:hypothetical protein
LISSRAFVTLAVVGMSRRGERFSMVFVRSFVADSLCCYFIGFFNLFLCVSSFVVLWLYVGVGVRWSRGRSALLAVAATRRDSSTQNCGRSSFVSD